MLLFLLFSLLGLSLAAVTPAPAVKCPGGLAHLEKKKEGKFVIQCVVARGTRSIQFVGCITAKGTEMAIGSKLEENKKEFYCTPTDGGGARLEITPLIPTATLKPNKKCEGKYENGQTFRFGGMGRYIQLCVSTPTTAKTFTVRCALHSGKEMNLGTQLKEGNVMHNCVRWNNEAIWYSRDA